MLHRYDDPLSSRTSRDPRLADEPALGPYEMRYDVRRGYDEPGATDRRTRPEPAYAAHAAPDR